MEEDTEPTKIMGEEFDNALSEELYETENPEQKLTENENNEDNTGNGENEEIDVSFHIHYIQD